MKKSKLLRPLAEEAVQAPLFFSLSPDSRNELPFDDQLEPPPPAHVVSPPMVVSMATEKGKGLEIPEERVSRRAGSAPSSASFAAISASQSTPEVFSLLLSSPAIYAPSQAVSASGSAAASAASAVYAAPEVSAEKHPSAPSVSSSPSVLLLTPSDSLLSSLPPSSTSSVPFPSSSLPSSSSSLPTSSSLPPSDSPHGALNSSSARNSASTSPPPPPLLDPSTSSSSSATTGTSLKSKRSFRHSFSGSISSTIQFIGHPVASWKKSQKKPPSPQNLTVPGEEEPHHRAGPAEAFQVRRASSPGPILRKAHKEQQLQAPEKSEQHKKKRNSLNLPSSPLQGKHLLQSGLPEDSEEFIPLHDPDGDSSSSWVFCEPGENEVEIAKGIVLTPAASGASSRTLSNSVSLRRTSSPDRKAKSMIKTTPSNGTSSGSSGSSLEITAALDIAMTRQKVPRQIVDHSATAANSRGSPSQGAPLAAEIPKVTPVPRLSMPPLAPPSIVTSVNAAAAPQKFVRTHRRIKSDTGAKPEAWIQEEPSLSIPHSDLADLVSEPSAQEDGPAISDIPEEPPAAKKHNRSIKQVVSAIMAANRLIRFVAPEPAEVAEIDGRTLVVAGSAESLLDVLIQLGTLDVGFAQNFLATFQYFLTPEQLFQGILKRYEGRETKLSINTEEAKLWTPYIKLRLVNVLSMWFNSYPSDFEGPLREKLQAFLEAEKNEPLQHNLAESLLKAVAAASPDSVLNSQRTHRRDLVSRFLGEVGSPPPTPTSLDPTQESPISPSPLLQHVMLSSSQSRLEIKAHSFAQLEFKPKEMAKQITLLEMELFRNIRPAEFYFGRWTKKATKDQDSPNLIQMIRWFDNVCFWMATEICSSGSLHHRVTLLKRFIMMGQYFLSYRNFNGVYEVVSGLSLAPVYRLKKTWKELPSKCKTVWKQLLDFTSANDNFAQYRGKLSERKFPTIPFLGLFLTDLTYLETAHQNHTKDGRINFYKFQKMGPILHAIQQDAQRGYPFEEIPKILRWLNSVTILDSSQLLTQSKIWEP